MTTAWLGSLLIVAMTVLYYQGRAGGILQRPATVMDHVGRSYHEWRRPLLLVPAVRGAMPRGATVSVFEPRNGEAPKEDSNFLIAAGLLPQHIGLPAFAADRSTPPENLPEYVVAIGSPFQHPRYGLLFET